MKKFALTRSTQGTGKEHSRLRLWAQRLMGSFAATIYSLP